jgi:arylsulfatase A-like enzyme
MATQPPNLVVCLPDQHAVTALGCYGNDQIETPAIDSLAGGGVRFENAYCTQPVCTPSRSAIMTGQYPHTTGLTENNTPLPADARCLPELGEFEGYATAYMGKWDLGDEVFAQHGFDRWVSIEDGYRDQYTSGPESARSSYHQFLVENGLEPDAEDGTFSRSFAAGLDEEYTKTAFLADEAVGFVEEHRNQPFMLFVAPLPPHSPYTGPRDDQYDAGDVSLPPNFEGADGQSLKHDLARAATFEPSGEAGWRELLSRYWGLASLVDTHVGRVLDALDDAGVADRTVTAYTSDHGDMMGHNATTGKNVLFDAATRVPLVLRGPGLDGGRVVDHPVSQIDLVPTLLDALGQPVPDHLHGHSLLPFLDGEADEPAEPLVFVEDNGPDGNAIDRRKDEWPDSGSRPQPAQKLIDAVDADEAAVRRAYLEPVRTVVTPDGLKLNCYYGGERELYDLREDPSETENLADREAYADRVEALTGAVRDWQVRTRDPVYLP